MLRRGSHGDEVEKMQQRLLDMGYSLPRFGADGDFGRETEMAVRDFQYSNNLRPDGIVGPLTLAVLFKTGQPAPAPEPAPEEPAPAKPGTVEAPTETDGFTYPFFQSDVEDMFGDPDYGEWAQEFITTVDLSEFRPHFDHVVDYEGNRWNYKIGCNRAMAGPLRKAVKLLVDRGLTGMVHSYDGCFNIRPKKGGSGLSMHSYGLAIDLDASRNPFRSDGELVTTFSRAFVRCWCDAGFEWGGSWDSPKDAMHFQIAWIRERSGPYAPVPYS